MEEAACRPARSTPLRGRHGGERIQVGAPRDLNATTTSRAGWYFDLPVSGEKLIEAMCWTLVPVQAAFNTVIPGAAGTAGTCTNSMGSGSQYVIDVPTGSGQRYVTSVMGLPGPALFLEGETSETRRQHGPAHPAPP